MWDRNPILDRNWDKWPSELVPDGKKMLKKELASPIVIGKFSHYYLWQVFNRVKQNSPFAEFEKLSVETAIKYCTNSDYEVKRWKKIWNGFEPILKKSKNAYCVG